MQFGQRSCVAFICNQSWQSQKHKDLMFAGWVLIKTTRRVQTSIYFMSSFGELFKTNLSGGRLMLNMRHTHQQTYTLSIFSPWNSDNIASLFLIIFGNTENWNTLECLLHSQFEQISMKMPVSAMHQCGKRWELLFLVTFI